MKKFGMRIWDFGLKRGKDQSPIPQIQNHKSKITNPKSEIAMTETALKDRTRSFALRIIKLVDAIPTSVSGKVIANQIVRAGTSVGANYRAACRGRSKAEFIAKLGTCEEEADECCYWLDLLEGSGLVAAASLVELRNEANELTAIFVSSIKTARGPKNA